MMVVSRFANAESDDELIDFVRSFGPVISKSWKILPFDPRIRPKGTDGSEVQVLMRAQQNLQELRIEQRIYKAALGLVIELVKKPAEFDFDGAKRRMVEIARIIQGWPRQWNREKKLRGQNPLWKIRGTRCDESQRLRDPAPTYYCLLRLTRES